MPNFDDRIYVGTDLGKVSGTVTSLPAGYVLGEERWENLVKYRLVCNAGNSQISQGNCAQPINSAGPYSVTVSTTSDTMAFGAVVAYNATAATGVYFWGAVRGRMPLVPNTSIATGGLAILSANGVVINAFTLPTAAALNRPIAINLGGAASKTGTTSTLSGDFLVNIE